MKAITLTPGTTTLTELEDIYRSDGPVKLDRVAKAGVEAAAEQIAAAVEGG